MNTNLLAIRINVEIPTLDADDIPVDVIDAEVISELPTESAYQIHSMEQSIREYFGIQTGDID